MVNFKDSCGVGFIADRSGRSSHKVIERALEAVTNLTHRGATLADGRTGDGSGVLFQIPKDFFRKEAKRIDGKEFSNVAVGFFFLKGEVDRALKLIVEECDREFGSSVVREVPVNERECGEIARRSMPKLFQVIVPASSEVKVYLTRRRLEKKLKELHRENYIVSFSTRLITYKGMLLAPDLGKFYPDLSNPEFKSSFAIFHQRYSTNTNPEWRLAQPLRLIAHNGEINTITANRNFIKSVEPILSHPKLGGKLKELLLHRASTATAERARKDTAAKGLDTIRAEETSTRPSGMNLSQGLE
jgi:glutamate synthase (NADPH/NADH) large chain